MVWPCPFSLKEGGRSGNWQGYPVCLTGRVTARIWTLLQVLMQAWTPHFYVLLPAYPCREPSPSRAGGGRHHAAALGDSFGSSLRKKCLFLTMNQNRKAVHPQRQAAAPHTESAKSGHRSPKRSLLSTSTGACGGCSSVGLTGNDLSLSLPSGWAERRRDGCLETELAPGENQKLVCFRRQTHAVPGWASGSRSAGASTQEPSWRFSGHNMKTFCLEEKGWFVLKERNFMRMLKIEVEIIFRSGLVESFKPLPPTLNSSLLSATESHRGNLRGMP